MGLCAVEGAGYTTGYADGYAAGLAAGKASVVGRAVDFQLSGSASSDGNTGQGTRISYLGTNLKVRATVTASGITLASVSGNISASAQRWDGGSDGWGRSASTSFTPTIAQA